MERYQNGLLFLGFGIVFALSFWWNHKSGIAAVNWAIRVERRTHPVGFWIIQVLWATLAAFGCVFGLVRLIAVFLG